MTHVRRPALRRTLQRVFVDAASAYRTLVFTETEYLSQKILPRVVASITSLSVVVLQRTAKTNDDNRQVRRQKEVGAQDWTWAIHERPIVEEGGSASFTDGRRALRSVVGAGAGFRLERSAVRQGVSDAG